MNALYPQGHHVAFSPYPHHVVREAMVLGGRLLRTSPPTSNMLKIHPKCAWANRPPSALYLFK